MSRTRYPSGAQGKRPAGVVSSDRPLKGNKQVPAVPNSAPSGKPILRPPAGGDYPDVRSAALAYHAAGFSVIPVKADGTKQPRGPWKPWQKERVPRGLLDDWFPPGVDGVGLAVVAGQVSGNAELLDFDRDAERVFRSFMELIAWERPGLLDRLAVVKSPGGYHLWLRCQGVVIPGNTKLASDPNFAGGGQTVIETRGEGGYALVPGCPAACHSTGRPYLPCGGVALAQLRPISPEERALLWRTARSFDVSKRPLPGTAAPPGPLTPLDDFDRNGPDWSELLVPAGWECVRTDGAARFWRRPGKDGRTWSATTGHCRGKNGEELFRVFSSNAAPFEDGQAYGKARTKAFLHHGGDLSAAAGELARQGYGGAPPRHAGGGRREPAEPPPAGPTPAAGDAAQLPALDRLVAHLSEVAFHFHDGDGQAWLKHQRAGHWEVSPLPSKGASDFIRTLWQKHEGRVIGRETLASAVEAVATLARCKGPELAVATRVAGDIRDRVFIDLADEERHVVEVTPGGWRVVTEPPVLFRRGRTMRPLPLPLRGGKLDELRTFVNVKADPQWVLLKAWLVNALCPGQAKAVLVLTGQQGTGKSMCAKLLSRLIDPCSTELRADPRDQQDLIIAASASWLTCFDNLSRMPSWLSDSLCRLSTGGTVGVRQLYTTDEERTWTVIRPVVLTSIEDVATAGDLLSRCVLIELPVIEPQQRASEQALLSLWEGARPRVFGALLDALAAAMRELPAVDLAELPRMADFAKLAVAAGRAAGYTAEDFLEAYRGNEMAGHQTALEGSPLCAALCKLLDAEPRRWQGTATELLGKLNEQASPELREQKAWPKNARTLSADLARLAPALNAVGIRIEMGRAPNRSRRRLISLAVKN